MTMHRPTLVALAAALLLGCPQSSSSDGTATADESGTGESTGSTSNPMTESLSNSASNSETEPDPTTETTLTTDPDSSSTDPTDATTTGGEECTEKNECIVDDDCAPGQTCTGCLCFGEAMGCADYGEGVFGDCLTDLGTVDNTACMADGGACVVDDVNAPTAGVCYFACEEPCDCPQPPAGFETQVACDLLTDNKQTECFISCAGGADCPTDMYCIANFLCIFGDAPTGIPNYGDCGNVEGACEDGPCLSNNPPDPDWTFCAVNCMDDEDCPAPAQGNSTQTCIDYSGEGDLACALLCGNNVATCPDGMYCDAGFGICAWDVGEPWSNCVADPPEACPTDYTCVSNEPGVNGICGESCDDAADCDAAPATGTALVVCTDLGAGNVCNLSCAMGETCPDGTACIDDLYCAYEVQ